MKKILLSLAFLSLTSLGFAQKRNNYTIISSQVMKAKEKGDLKLADSLAQDYINNYLFKLKREDLYTKENLSFMGDFLCNENTKAFKLFMKEPKKVNAILGAYQAQTKIMFFINKKYLPQGDFKTIKKPDWDALEKVVISKFGILGREIINAQRMVYYFINEDWKFYGIWYQKYFEIGLKHSLYHVNNFSWVLFEHVEDPKILSFACDVMKYSLENFDKNNIEAYDTYANLLYKMGKKDQAMKWEQKAVKLSNNKESMVRTLEKMKNNERTWPVVTNNYNQIIEL